MATVFEITRFEELASYRLVWHELWLKTRNATFFQSYEWFATYWRHFGGDQKLRVLVVCSSDQPIGLLPLVIHREATRIGPVRVLTYPLQDWGDFFGPIGPHPTATLLAGLRTIADGPREWDLIDLRWVDTSRCDHGRTPAAMRQVGLEPSAQIWKRSAIIDLRGGWDRYWSERSAKFRNNLRRAEKRLADLGNVEFLRYRPQGALAGDDDPRWDLFDTCVELAARSWQAERDDGNTLCHPEIREFLEAVHAEAVKLGCLDLNLLMINGQAVAFAYNYVFAGRVFGLRTGYDPAWAEASPGNILKLRMIQDSFARGDVEFDLGPGSLESKQPWATHFVDSYRYTHFSAGSARAQILRWKRWWEDRVRTPEEILARRPA